MNTLTGPFSGDVKPAPGPKDGEQQWDAASSLHCTPATLETPYQDGVFDYHKSTQLLSVATEVKLPHGSAQLSSPFQGDFRPGVDSSKK